MPKLRIRYVGPIMEGFHENDGFMEISPVVLICGDQATGKSTIAKLYSTFCWLEKSMQKDLNKVEYKKEDFLSLLKNQRIDKYVNKESEIDYVGDIYSFSYRNDIFSATRISDSENYVRPKIMYIPSERNMLTVLEDSENMKNLPLMVSILMDEYRKARRRLAKISYRLPVSDISITYNQDTSRTMVVTEDRHIDITDASSGIQSVTPLSIVSDYLSEEVNTSVVENIQNLSLAEREDLKQRIKDILESDKMELNGAFDQMFKTGSVKGIDSRSVEILKSLLNRYFNSRFINIVEEPEQNLYPESQCKVLYKLLECLNSNIGNQLIITTHSPYIISYLTLAAKAKQIASVSVPVERISHIVPEKAMVSGDVISIYETDKDGNIRILKSYENLPSDENMLNKELAEFNELFSELLDLEAEFCV